MADSKGNTRARGSKEVVIDLDCSQGVCGVKPRKLFAQTLDQSKSRPPLETARPMVDMLHGDVDLDHLFGA